MKIDKHKFDKDWFCYYYRDSKTKTIIPHGLWGGLPLNGVSIGYSYHDQIKGFWLRKVK